MTLTLQEAQFIINYIFNEYQKSKISYEQCIKNKLSYNQAKQIAEALSTCCCCKKHQINRPTTILVKYEEYPFHNTQLVNCECRCRQNIRILNRIYSPLYKRKKTI